MPRRTNPRTDARQTMRRKTTVTRSRNCYFCVNMIMHINYKHGDLLKKFMSSYSKILPKRKTGLCATHQRKLARAIKHARVNGIVPFLTQ